MFLYFLLHYNCMYVTGRPGATQLGCELKISSDKRVLPSDVGVNQGKCRIHDNSGLCLPFT